MMVVGRVGVGLKWPRASKRLLGGGHYSWGRADGLIIVGPPHQVDRQAIRLVIEVGVLPVCLHGLWRRLGRDEGRGGDDGIRREDGWELSGRGRRGWVGEGSHAVG